MTLHAKGTMADKGGTNLDGNNVGGRVVQLLRRLQFPRLVETVVGGVHARAVEIARYVRAYSTAR